jgi:hypothetical protein
MKPAEIILIVLTMINLAVVGVMFYGLHLEEKQDRLMMLSPTFAERWEGTINGKH